MNKKIVLIQEGILDDFRTELSQSFLVPGNKTGTIVFCTQSEEKNPKGVFFQNISFLRFRLVKPPDIAKGIKTHHKQEGDDKTDEPLSGGLPEKHLQADNQQFSKVVA